MLIELLFRRYPTWWVRVISKVRGVTVSSSTRPRPSGPLAAVIAHGHPIPTDPAHREPLEGEGETRVSRCLKRNIRSHASGVTVRAEAPASDGTMMTRMLGIGVTLLVASAALFARQDTGPVNGLSRSGVPDVRQIIESSIEATQRHWQARLHYTYLERDASRRQDMDGRVKSEDVEISRTILVNDAPFEQFIERNGHPPSAREERRQNEALDKLRRETPDQRTERVRQQKEETASLVREVPNAFDFQLVGQEVVNERAAYVLRATPHAGYQAQGRYGKLLSKVEGKLWIDTHDLVWIKVDGQVVQPFSIGVFLVRLLRGSQITVEQTRVDGGMWMPIRVEVRAAAKILLLKSLVIERVMTYSDYRRAGADAPATPPIP